MFFAFFILGFQSQTVRKAKHQQQNRKEFADEGYNSIANIDTLLIHSCLKPFANAVAMPKVW